MKQIIFYILFFLTVSILIRTQAAEACSIPVFRYAIERFEAGKYEVEVVKGNLPNDDEKKAVELLQSYANDPNINFVVRDLNSVNAPTEGRIRVYFPQLIGRAEPVWDTVLSVRSIEQIVDSPARREIARRLIDGQSAVCVFIESGNKDKDNQAFAALEEELRKLKATIKLPEAAENSTLNIDDSLVRIDFSTIRTAKSNVQEEFLIKSLLCIEPDLSDYTAEPMVFPIFGRGRILPAIVGRGINPEVIARACLFICGPCSCPIKIDNTAVDLLLRADWESIVKTLDDSYQLMPELIGVSGFIGLEQGPASTTELSVGDLSAQIKPLSESRRPGTVVLTSVSILACLAAGIVIVSTGIIHRLNQKKK